MPEESVIAPSRSVLPHLHSGPCKSFLRLLVSSAALTSVSCLLSPTFPLQHITGCTPSHSPTKLFKSLWLASHLLPNRHGSTFQNPHPTSPVAGPSPRALCSAAEARIGAFEPSDKKRWSIKIDISSNSPSLQYSGCPTTDLLRAQQINAQSRCLSLPPLCNLMESSKMDMTAGRTARSTSIDLFASETLTTRNGRSLRESFEKLAKGSEGASPEKAGLTNQPYTSKYEGKLIWRDRKVHASHGKWRNR